MPNPQPTLGFVLNDVARLLRKRFEQRARCLGLTRAQWQVLAYLSANEGIHQGGLADLLDIEPITLVRILDKLEVAGMVERRRHATDRRLWLLYLTPAAHPMLARMRLLGDATRQEALEGLSDEERAQLLHMLTTMKRNLLDACDRPVETADAQA
ncbi:MarR family winged helix-turn-helix transcriptional regulator [Roseococcus sp.]|uniref:MarR family winged helix-turn-helix transcriptional regulator n=1 Tax=Roseococcus sp. TaxID=2109646 RepID=UPI003BAD1547